MKEIHNFWVDGNNNKWSKTNYTKDQAIKHSNSCIDCVDCVDCVDCRSCRSCGDCRNCRSCDDCINCVDCISAKNRKTQPSIYHTQRIGSRKSITYFYFSLF